MVVAVVVMSVLRGAVVATITVTEPCWNWVLRPCVSVEDRSQRFSRAGGANLASGFVDFRSVLRRWSWRSLILSARATFSLCGMRYGRPPPVDGGLEHYDQLNGVRVSSGKVSLFFILLHDPFLAARWALMRSLPSFCLPRSVAHLSDFLDRHI